MLTAAFDFDLPASSIAQHPAPRGTARLLVLNRTGPARHRLVGALPDLLEPGDLLVVNDTRVIPARLFALRPGTTGRVELLLVDKVTQDTWLALLKPGRRARPGTRLELEGTQGLGVEIAEKLGDGRHVVRFDEPIEPHLETIGHVPLPPYVKRPDGVADRELYQTVFARHAGAIAAPTAGLHFTTGLLMRLAEKGVQQTSVTLHVGIGTFKPVTATLAHEHRMEAERWEITPEAAEQILATKARGGRIVAVGTTVVRTLESAASGPGGLAAGAGSTELFIRPGYQFQLVDVLLTNFHLPRSTLLMLVCAFAGRERVLTAYKEAIDCGYRFYSYGDAMLAEKA